MRRAAGIALGAVTGAALLIGAKLGNTAPSDVASADAPPVVVRPGVTPVPAPRLSASPGHHTSVPSPRSTTPRTTAPRNGRKDGTYNASTGVRNGRFGTLSMSVTIAGGKITRIVAGESGGEPDCWIGACDILRPEALRAQSAHIAAVSGATYTTSAFKSTLQAILDSAA